MREQGAINGMPHAGKSSARRGQAFLLHWTFAAFLFVIAGTIGMWSLVSHAPTSFNSRPQPLRIALNPWSPYEFAHLAQDKGYFQTEGVDVQLVDMTSAADTRRVYERGQVDGLFATSIELLFARQQSHRQPQIVAVVDYSDGADVILARKPMSTVRDLKGKRVGVDAKTLSEVLLWRALEKAGLSWSDIQAINVPLMQQQAMFARGELDAVATFPPESLELLRRSDVAIIFSSKQTPGEIMDTLAFDADTIRQRPRDVAAVRRAFFRAEEFARTNPGEAYAAMAARQRIRIEDFAAPLTDGIQLVDQKAQSQYFGPHGLLQSLLDQTDRALMEMEKKPAPTRLAPMVATIPLD